MGGLLSGIRGKGGSDASDVEDAPPELAPEAPPVDRAHGAGLATAPMTDTAPPSPSADAGARMPGADDSVMGHLARAVGVAIEAQSAAASSPAGAASLASASLTVQTLLNAARAVGVPDEQIAGAFARHGARGGGLLRALQAPSKSLDANPAVPSSAEVDRGAGAGGGSVVGTVLDGIARLVAAPIVLPVAAGSRVWQAVRARGAVARLNEQGAVLERGFDEAYGRAIEKIAHIKSGPMNGLLTEMVHNPLKPDEQYRRMATDADGEYHERAQRLEQVLADPRVQQQYRALHDALGDVKHSAARLGEFGAEHGQPVSDRIETAMAGLQDAMRHEGVELPALKDGKLSKLSEQLGEIVERIKAMLANLFGRRSAPAA